VSGLENCLEIQQQNVSRARKGTEADVEILTFWSTPQRASAGRLKPSSVQGGMGAKDTKKPVKASKSAPSEKAGKAAWGKSTGPEESRRLTGERPGIRRRELSTFLN